MMFRMSASIVMAGLVTAFHVFGMMEKKDVDARDKPGHDASEERARFLRQARQSPAYLE